MKSKYIYKKKKKTYQSFHEPNTNIKAPSKCVSSSQAGPVNRLQQMFDHVVKIHIYMYIQYISKSQ